MKAAPVLFCLGLAACSVSVPAPMPLAASGPTEVVLGGASYMADLQPTPNGAQITVTRDNVAFGLDEGFYAKSVAKGFCAARGQRLDPRALGSFGGGQWVFDGGCE